jgi:hypothetical protein
MFISVVSLQYQTEFLGVLIEPKQNENNRNKLKQGICKNITCLPIKKSKIEEKN